MDVVRLKSNRNTTNDVKRTTSGAMDRNSMGDLMCLPCTNWLESAVIER